MSTEASNQPDYTGSVKATAEKTFILAITAPETCDYELYIFAKI